MGRPHHAKGQSPGTGLGGVHDLPDIGSIWHYVRVTSAGMIADKFMDLALGAGGLAALTLYAMVAVRGDAGGTRQ